MKYANVSTKFPAELDAEIERFLEETGIYTNKSEFVRAACREHLERLQDDPAIAALRLEQMLARAETSRLDDDEVEERLADFRDRVDAEDVAEAVADAREETVESLLE
jgi:Arc/MetJ-type ribon-helix-helix transcriptional regulator